MLVAKLSRGELPYFRVNDLGHWVQRYGFSLVSDEIGVNRNLQYGRGSYATGHGVGDVPTGQRFGNIAGIDIVWKASPSLGRWLAR
jgi:hypothetical protein